MAIEPISDYSEGMLKYYFGVVAAHLTGRKTRIVFQDVIRKSATRGTVYKENGKDAVILLKRGIGWEASFRAFLHECGHIKRTWGDIWDINGSRIKFPDTIGEPSVKSTIKVAKIEHKAIEQAEMWYSWARKRAGTPLIQPQLDALLDYPND